MFISWFKNFPVRIAKAKLLNNYRDDRDNWIYNKVKFSLGALGYKLNTDMSFYLKGESSINIMNVEELRAWLICCQYEPLLPVHNKNTVFQAPLEFEESCKGNCLESSLWVWRKLFELGFNAELIVGERFSNEILKQHAWVVFENNNYKVLVETVCKEKDGVFSELGAVRHLYVPWASVDSKLDHKLYGGYCSAIKRENNWTF